MKNKKAMISGVFVIIILLLLIGGYVGVDSDKILSISGVKTAKNQVKKGNDKIAKLIEYDMFEGINQCIWGTWVITEVWYGYSLHNEDERTNTVIKILPQSFSYGEKTSTELDGYLVNLMAIKDNDNVFFDIDTFQNLGMNGEYCLMLHPCWDDHEKNIFPLWGFVLLSETEMIIPCAGHTRCMLKKIEDFDTTVGDVPLMAGEQAVRSSCYGKWYIAEKLTKDKMFKNDSYIGQIVTVKRGGFASCRVFGRSEEKIDELAVLIGVGNENKYLVCYDFPEDYIWDQMICVDDRTAVLVKGSELFLEYLIRRKIAYIAYPIDENK